MVPTASQPELAERLRAAPYITRLPAKLGVMFSVI